MEEACVSNIIYALFIDRNDEKKMSNKFNENTISLFGPNETNGWKDGWKVMIEREDLKNSFR